MDPGVRSAILIAGLVFVIMFAGMTLVVMAKDGFTILVFFSVLIVVLLGIALWGAINSTDDRR